MLSAFAHKFDRQVNRFFEIFPGFLTWLLLLSPIWLGLIAPKILIFYITFLTVYWFYLAAKLAFGIVIGYGRHKKEMATDWSAELRALDFNSLPERSTLPASFESLKYFILVPIFNEEIQVLQDSLDGLLSQTYNLSKITLVYAIEEKYADRVKADLDNILSNHRNKFDQVMYFVHPAGIAGEAIGVAGANRTWGGKHAVEALKSQGVNIRDYVFLTFDSDSVLSPQFLTRLAVLYYTNDRRDNKFFSTAVHLFDNNLWEVPFMMRIEANMVTLGSLADWIFTSKKVKDTFSCYAVSLQTLIDADFWDVQVGVDDTIFYWRAFLARDGEFEGAEHYIPYSADAVMSDTYAKSHVSMYRQLLRWGWGVISMPISMTAFLKSKTIPFGIKFHWFVKHIETKVLMITVVFLITFGISLVTLINPFARQLNLVYSLPNLMSLIMSVTMVFLLPVTIYRLKIIKPMPKEWSIFKKFFVLLEGPLIILNLFTYSFLPWIEAQTRLMFGKRMKDLYHTPKVRKV